MSAFIKIAKTSELRPGQMKCLRLDGRRVLLANVAGEFLAADDRCTHEDASLATGSLKGDLVKCPLHGSRFNLRTGDALEEPACERLVTYAVRVEGDDVLLGPPASLTR